MYCTACGTKLPDNARFCSSCGASVTQNQPSQQVPSFTDQESEQIMQFIAEAVTAPVADAVRYFRQLAEAGPVTSKAVKEAVELRNQAQSGGLTIPPHSVLNYYALAHDTERFFAERWLSIFVQGQRGKINHTVLKEDWNLYIPGGLSRLLSVYPKIDRTTTDTLLYQFKGLAIWLEDCLLEHALVAFGFAGIKLTKDELFMATNRVGTARATVILNRVKNIREMTR